MYYRRAQRAVVIAILLSMATIPMYRVGLDAQPPIEIQPKQELQLPLTTVLEVKPVELPKPTPPPSRGGDPQAKVMEGFEVTWYNNYYDKTDITKSGAKTVDGITISVDPSVIKLGTWVEIMMPDGTVYKRKAQDTGSKVKGKVIDIYADVSLKELRQRGRTRGAIVRILGGE